MSFLEKNNLFFNLQWILHVNVWILHINLNLLSKVFFNISASKKSVCSIWGDFRDVMKKLVTVLLYMDKGWISCSIWRWTVTILPYLICFVLLPYKHTTCILRWNNVETVDVEYTWCVYKVWESKFRVNLDRARQRAKRDSLILKNYIQTSVFVWLSIFGCP